MEQLIQTLLAGGGASVVFQLAKGDWNKYLSMVLAVASGFALGFQAGGAEGGIAAAVAALATHAVAFKDTPLGTGMKLHLAPRFLRLVSDLAKQLAEAFEKSGENPPVPPGA